MTHQRFRAWLHLSLYDELSDPEKHLMEEHLARCEHCRVALEQLKALHHTLGSVERVSPSEQMLWEARQGLRAVLRLEQDKRSAWDRLTEMISTWTGALTWGWVPRYGMALGGLVLFALGVFLGSRGLVPDSVRPYLAVQPVADDGNDALSRGDVEITNVQFVDPDTKDGQIEFVFEAVRPVRMKGSIDDPRIQKVLTYAVINEQNPGVRLRAVNAIGSSRQQPADSEFKTALITALTSDTNTGVRKDAFAALQKFPFDEDIKSAFLHVLTHDTNSGLRIAAINSLEKIVSGQRRADQDLVNVLKARVESDENTYIRTRARAVLEEIEQQ